MTQWLTLEVAAQAASVEQKQLEECLTDSAPEVRFQAHGLLFDRKRWQAGKEFLQLLEQPASSSASTATAQPPLQTSSEEKRSYRWHETPIRLQITWLPLSPNAKERQVLIAATNHDDFPVSNIIGESELGELPTVLAQLLKELKAELPLRQLRYQHQPPKAKSTKSSASSTSSSTSKRSSQNSQPVVKSPPPTQKQKSSSTQISLF